MPVCPWQAPFHQLGSELSMTWMKSPRRKPSSPSSWGSKSKRAWTYVGCCKRGAGEHAGGIPNPAKPLQTALLTGGSRCLPVPTFPIQLHPHSPFSLKCSFTLGSFSAINHQCSKTRRIYLIEGGRGAILSRRTARLPDEGESWDLLQRFT
jgi:hypothetical protein